MATAVFFHAHPDDEAIATGGTMAKAVAQGHRVVLVVATKGEHGEVAENYLDEGEELWQRRVRETEDSAKALGAHRVEFLGYVDSGMIDTPENKAPESFWQADLDEAAGRLADILRVERADVLTAYDPNGNYGHPDHIQVHRVGVRAAELAGVKKVYENTINRDYVIELMARAKEFGMEMEDAPNVDNQEEFNLGMPGDVITTVVDVRAHLDAKKAAMRAHASQIAETSFFLAMPDEAFEAMWGQEWFILRGAAEGTRETDLFEGL
jgi:N-acetyl-1-D-myo-inositol-2-amino-2-deoxy-alpha-D-glucopyranoside deacetylase